MSRKVTEPVYQISIKFGGSEYLQGCGVNDLPGVMRVAQLRYSALIAQWNTARMDRQPRGPRPVVRVWKLIQVWEADEKQGG